MWAEALLRLTLRLSMLVIGLAVGVQSIGTILVQVASADHRLLADQLEAGRQPGWAYLSEFDQERRVTAFAWTCRRDLMRDMISLRLSMLDAAFDLGDLAAIDAARAAATEALETTLACDPLDGNAWLRLAKIDLRFTGPTDRVLDALVASQWSAPNEGWVLRQRLPLVAHLVAAGVEPADQLLRSDVRRFALGASPPELKAVLKDARGRAVAIAEDELSLLPAVGATR